LTATSTLVIEMSVIARAGESEGDLLLPIRRDGDLRTFINDGRDMAGAQIRSDGGADARLQVWRALLPLQHLQEQHDPLVCVRLAPLPDAEGIFDVRGEVLQ